MNPPVPTTYNIHMHVLVDLPDGDVRALDALSEKLKTSRSALVREAISEYLERNRSVTLDDTFGLWKHRQVDGVDYQRTLRDEWGE